MCHSDAKSERMSGCLRGMKTGTFQLSADEMALWAGWRVTWNINANYPYSESELAALARLEKLYPGKFTVNRI